MKTFSSQLTLGCVVAVAALATSCGALSNRVAEVQPPADGTVQVEVLIYSGRPNPRFTLRDEGDLATLDASLDQAVPNLDFAGESITPSRLGYAGVLLREPNRYIAVHAGDIQITGKDTRFLTDGGALEAWLLDRALASEALTPEQLRLARGR